MDENMKNVGTGLTDFPDGFKPLLQMKIIRPGVSATGSDDLYNWETPPAE